MIRRLPILACTLIALAPLQSVGHVAAVRADVRSSASYPPDLSDVACPGTRVCYTVGYSGVQYNGRIYASTDGGHHWRPQQAGTKWGLRGITCISTTTCYSVGYAETTVVTTNAGRSWRDPHTPRSPQALYRIACPTSTTCIATGNSPSGYIALVHRLLLTTNGARSWTYPATPIDRTAFPMNGVACPSARVCYVVGAYATILVTSDAGRTWQQQHDPAMDSNGLIPPLTSVACANPLTCVAVGGFPSGAVILTTVNGGRTWTSAASPAQSALTGVACPTTRICYITGSGGTIEQTHDGGHTWTLIDSGTSTSLNSVACHGPGFCVVVGNAGFITLLPVRARSGAAATATPASSATPVPNAPTAQPTQPPAATATTTQPSTSCASWDVSGTWQFQSMTMGNGPASLQQSGTTLSGSMTAGGVTWTLQGSIQSSNVTLNMSAAGQVAQSFQGTISSDGATIDGNAGTFSGHATCAH
jgi:photosystem II stability/assembly factor-like uncharacterized protein